MTAFAVVAAGAWVPVLWRFFSTWRKRHNPVSLAICLTILLLIYTSIISIEHLEGDIDAKWLWLGFLAFDVLVCLNFYISFWWSSRRFPDRRGSNSSS